MTRSEGPLKRGRKVRRAEKAKVTHTELKIQCTLLYYVLVDSKVM